MVDSLSVFRSAAIAAVLSGCSVDQGAEGGDESAESPTETTGETTGDSESTGGDGDEQACELGAQLLREDVLHELNIELSDSDWAAMIAEAQNSPEYGGPDKIYRNATLSLDGEALASQVAVRLKGHYSLVVADGHKYPMKLDFDRVDDTQDLDGLTKINLHPNGEGNTVLNEYLSYGAIRSAGLATARVGFARVTVNGETLGLYSMVEHIKGKFVRCHFSEPYGDLYKPEEPIGNLAWRGDAIADYEDDRLPGDDPARGDRAGRRRVP